MTKNRINLIPRDIQSNSGNEISFEKALAGGSVLLILLVAVPALLMNSQIKKADAQRAVLKAESARLTAEMSGLGQTQSSPFPADLGSMEAILRAKKRWAEPLKELSALIPPSVWIVKSSHIVEAGIRKVAISGLAPSQDRVNDFFAALEGSLYYRNIMIRLSEKTNDTYPQLYKFDFTAEMSDSAPKAATR